MLFCEGPLFSLSLEKESLWGGLFGRGAGDHRQGTLVFVL